MIDGELCVFVCVLVSVCSIEVLVFYVVLPISFICPLFSQVVKKFLSFLKPASPLLPPPVSLYAFFLLLLTPPLFFFLIPLSLPLTFACTDEISPLIAAHTRLGLM